jgi:hypothetical protein
MKSRNINFLGPFSTLALIVITSGAGNKYNQIQQETPYEESHPSVV